MYIYSYIYYIYFFAQSVAGSYYRCLRQYLIKELSIKKKCRSKKLKNCKNAVPDTKTLIRENPKHK